MKATHASVLADMGLAAVPVSILDRANVRESGEAEALAATVQRAKRVEQLGYHRFWVAEHHGVPGIAGSAPTVLMAAVAAQTEKIRVGSGGVMLPSHPPLVVAEQAATLQALFPGRIDLGIGRSVGFTPAVRAALRQNNDAGDRFDADVAELMSYLTGTAPITARPYDDGATPLFVLATGKGTAVAAAAGLAVVVGGPVFTGGDAGRARRCWIVTAPSFGRRTIMTSRMWSSRRTSPSPKPRRRRANCCCRKRGLLRNRAPPASSRPWYRQRRSSRYR